MLVMFGLLLAPTMPAQAAFSPYNSYDRYPSSFYYTAENTVGIKYSTVAEACTAWAANISPNQWSYLVYTGYDPVITNGGIGKGLCRYDRVYQGPNDPAPTITQVSYQAYGAYLNACPTGFTQHYPNDPALRTCAKEKALHIAPVVTAQESASCPVAGNPIETATGNKLEVAEDYAPRASSLKVRRTYNSLGSQPGWSFNHTPQLSPPLAPSPAQASTSSNINRSNACGYWSQVVSQAPAFAAGTTSNYDIATHTCRIRKTINGVVTVVSTLQEVDGGFGKAYLVLNNKVLRRPNGKTVVVWQNQSSWNLSPDTPGTFSVISGGFRYVSPEDTTENYDSDGKLLSVTERGREPVSYAYSGGRLSSVTDSAGRSLGYGYDTSGRLSSIALPGSLSLQYGYDSSGRLSSVTYPDGKSKTYHYENSSFPQALTGITDENNVRFATWSYDSQGRAETSEHAGGVDFTSLVFNGNTTTVSDALGFDSTYTFSTVQGAPRLSSATQPCTSCGSAAATTYDSNGYVASRTDFKGVVTNYVNNSRGLETSRTEAFGTPQARTITTTWHSTFRLPLTVTEPGRVTTLAYNSLGNLSSKTVTDTATSSSRTTTYTSCELVDPVNGCPRLGLVRSIDGPRTDVSDVTTFDYDAQGNLSQVTNALGHVTQITQYDAHGHPKRLVDPNGIVTLLDYDARQRLVSRDTDGLLTSYEYDDAGQLEKVTLPDSSWLAYSYDAAHRLTGIADQDGNRIAYTLDLVGNRTEEKVYDPSNTLRRSQARVYDGLKRLKEIHGANGQLTVYGYDNVGNLTSETRNGSLIVSNEYDALGRLFKTTDAANGVTQYGYNARDGLTSVTDPRSLVTSYTLNAFGDATQLQSPDTGTSSSTYDSAGNLATRIDAKGQLATYSYDALNRLTQIVYSGGPTISYSYDQGTYGKGRLTGLNGPGAIQGWTYDAQGRLASQGQTVGGTTLTTSYSYDSAGRLATRTLPSGKVVGYAWAGNRLSGLTLGGNPLVSNLAWEPFGGASGWDFANGEQVARSFDLSGRMTGHSLGSIDYDTADRITGLTHGGLSHLGGSKTYGYDSLDRLTSYTGAQSIGYSYDATGNRSQQTATAGTTDYMIDSASNQLDSLSVNSATQSFSYDANGSLTTDGLHSYAYDATGRLAGVNGSTAYAYNGLGQRAAKTGSSGGTLYAYDEAGRMLGEYDASTGNPIQETIWMGDTPVAVVQGSSRYYVHADHLNTPRQIDNASGDPVWVWDTITFGGSAPDQDPLNSGTQFVYNLRFPGQYYDQESGLLQNWYREYNPGLGRYMESDPIGLFGGLNTYRYAMGNPTSFADPNGLEVTGTFDRRTGRLTLRDVDTGVELVAQAFSGMDECVNKSACEGRVDAGPIPKGKYLIGNGYDSGHGGDDWWYRLYGSDGNGGYRYDRVAVVDPETGKSVVRGGFNLHTGLVSLGCVTIPSDVDQRDESYPKSKKYNSIKKLLDATKPVTHKGSTFRGTLNVQ